MAETYAEKVMRLGYPVKPSGEGYPSGHYDARRGASLLAASADAEIARLKEENERMRTALLAAPEMDWESEEAHDFVARHEEWYESRARAALAGKPGPGSVAGAGEDKKGVQRG